MRTYGYYLFTRHLMDDQLRVGGPLPSPYHFEREDVGSEPLPTRLVLVSVVAYAVLVIGLVLAAVMTGGTDAGASTSAGRHTTPCHTSTSDKWSGCLPGGLQRIA